jgi:hypothetical protein
MNYVVIAGVEFVRLERDEAPYEISDVADESYDFVLSFQPGKYGFCVMAHRLTETGSITPFPSETFTVSAVRARLVNSAPQVQIRAAGKLQIGQVWAYTENASSTTPGRAN